MLIVTDATCGVCHTRMRVEDGIVLSCVNGCTDSLSKALLTYSSQEALRFNTGKTPYAELPFDLLDGAARVMEYGKGKYGANNYRKGYSDLNSPLNSALRHIFAIQLAINAPTSEEQDKLMLDEESGHAHIHHCITSLLLLVHTMRLKGIKV